MHPLHTLPIEELLEVKDTHEILMFEMMGIAMKQRVYVSVAWSLESHAPLLGM